MKTLNEQLKKEITSLSRAVGFNIEYPTRIGIDIGTASFKAVRLTSVPSTKIPCTSLGTESPETISLGTRSVRGKDKGKEFSVLDTCIKPLQELVHLKSSMRIDGEEMVYVNVAASNIAVKALNIPDMPFEEIEGCLKWELKEQVGFDIEKAQIKFDILGKTRNDDGTTQIQLLTLTYIESDIEKRIKELKDTGLNVQGVFPSCIGFASYVAHAHIVSPETKVALIDIGTHLMRISIVRDGRVYFTRDVGIGGEAFTDALTCIVISDKGKIEYSKEEAEKLKCEYGIPYDPKLLSMMRPVLEKLSSHVRDSLEYYSRQFKSEPVTKIILAGNGSRLKGLKEYVAKESGIEVIHVLPEHALAMGLALSKDNNLNILPAVFREEDKKKLKMISVRMLSFIVGLMFLFSYGLLCIKAHNLKKELEIYQKEWDTIKEIKILRDKMLVCNSAVDTVSRNSLHIGTIMKELTHVVIPGLVLDSVTIKDTEPHLMLKGVALKSEGLSEVMSNLENSPLCENVRLMFRKKSEKYSGDAVEFEITCKVVK